MSTRLGDMRRRVWFWDDQLQDHVLIPDESPIPRRPYNPPKDPSGVFRTVRFRTGQVFVYRTVERANIGRIYARALVNVPKDNKRSRSGWADLARATGIVHINPPGKKRTGMYGGVSERVFRMARSGRLPDDPEQLDKLFKLAGYPWK